jgi:hypothetical protein
VAKRNPDDYPEIKEIRSRLKFGTANDVVILFVPSHDRNDHPVSDQHIWANNALKLFGELFGGATGFKFLEGIYQPEGVAPLYDQPIMIESLVARERLNDDARLMRLSEFCRDMGQKTEQLDVGLVVNNYFYAIRILRQRRHSGRT